MNWKERAETLKTCITIGAILVGGYWTYYNFIMERRNFPHANLEQRISHIALSDSINLVRLDTELTNTGNARLVSGKCIVRIQQILPIPLCAENEPCAKEEINDALKKRENQQDRFSWASVAQRETKFSPALEIEPNEKDVIDFEFAVPSRIEVVRVSSYFRNDRKTNGNEIGWLVSTYYDFRKPRKEMGK